MDRFGPDSVAHFLRAIDRHLHEPTSVVIIGGSAIGLAYEPRHISPDIDLLRTSHAFRAACAQAKQETGLDIPVQEVGVYFAPES